MTLGRQCGLVKPSDWPSHGGLQLRADCGPGHKPPAPSALGLSFPTRGSRDGRAPAASHFTTSELAFSACHTQGSGVCSAKDGAHRTHAAPSTPPRGLPNAPPTRLSAA